MNLDFTVPSEAWIRALNTLQRVSKTGRPASDVVLKFGNNEVELLHAGTSVAMPANGRGQGQVAFSGSYIRPLASVMRCMGTEHVRIWQMDQELHVGTSTIICRWCEEFPAEAPLPSFTSLRQILQLRYAHDHAELVSAGLAECLFEAEAEKESMVAQAAEILRPLGISLPALDHFVRNCLKEDIRDTGRNPDCL